jgi:hypothetical protein
MANFFKLIWTSANEFVQIPCGEYPTIHEASADMPASKARLEAKYPVTEDFHYPHDLRGGTWRVVPITE